MSKSFTKIVLPVLAIVALLLVVAWMAGAFKQKVQPGSTPATSIAREQAFTATLSEQAIFEAVPASIEAKQATIMSSRILARIENIHVRAGDTVEKGQVMIELEKSDLQSRVSQADASVKSVSARLIEAKQSLERAIELTDKGLLAQADLDQARANHDALVADLASAEQALDEARTGLDFATVVAPISGRVIDRFAEPGDTAQPGVQLLSLYNPLSLRVEANVREQLALSLSMGQSIEVSVPALQRALDSHIEELVPAGNAGSRSFLVKSRLQHSEGLLPGMYAQLHVPAGVESLLLIPRDRVARAGQLDIVWVWSGDAVERRLIRTGREYPQDMVEVVSGLQAGEQILPIAGIGQQ